MLLAIYILAYLAVGLWSGIICLRTIFKRYSSDDQAVLSVFILFGWPFFAIGKIANLIIDGIGLLGRLIANFANRNDK